MQNSLLILKRNSKGNVRRFRPEIGRGLAYKTINTEEAFPERKF